MNIKAVLFSVMFLWLLIFGMLFVGGKVLAADVNLQWDAPTLNEDGTPIDDLGGYRIYHGFESYSAADYPDMIDVGLLSGSSPVYTYTGLGEGDHYFSVTAYDINGNESDYSNDVKKSLAIRPAPPTNLR